jgi:hypothetical protein
MDIASEKKLGSRIKGKSGDRVLEVNWITFVKTVLYLRDSITSMSLENIKMADPFFAEEWTSYSTVKPWVY